MRGKTKLRQNKTGLQSSIFCPMVRSCGLLIVKKYIAAGSRSHKLSSLTVALWDRLPAAKKLLINFM